MADDTNINPELLAQLTKLLQGETSTIENTPDPTPQEKAAELSLYKGLVGQLLPNFDASKLLFNAAGEIVGYSGKSFEAEPKPEQKPEATTSTIENKPEQKVEEVTAQQAAHRLQLIASGAGAGQASGEGTGPDISKLESTKPSEVAGSLGDWLKAAISHDNKKTGSEG